MVLIMILQLRESYNFTKKYICIKLKILVEYDFNSHVQLEINNYPTKISIKSNSVL